MATPTNQPIGSPDELHAIGALGAIGTDASGTAKCPSFQPFFDTSDDTTSRAIPFLFSFALFSILFTDTDLLYGTKTL